jgi:hypothetical protein
MKRGRKPNPRVKPSKNNSNDIPLDFILTKASNIFVNARFKNPLLK